MVTLNVRGTSRLVLSALAMTAMTGAFAAVPSAAVPITPQGDVPGIHWRSCPTPGAPTLQCGTLLVPYDYSTPGGSQFTLAVTKLPATGKKTGSLFFDPGGPGGSGTDVVEPLAGFLPTSVRATFDLIGWDPRGIGATRPVLRNCPLPRLVVPTSGTVNWTRARSRSSVVVAAANRTCQKNNARFINYMGTNNVARDLDRLRAAVGDSKLTYWAISYGTRIGYVYALMFPGRVRAMVLDGNIDPRGTFAGLTQGGVALDSALQFMQTVRPAIRASILATIASLDAAPIALGSGVSYTRWDYLSFMSSVIPNERSWPFIIANDQQISLARTNTPEGAAVRVQLRAQRAESDGNLGGAFSVVNCLDYADRMSASAQNAVITHNASVAPVFGGLITAEYSLGCAGLTLRPDPVPTTRPAANRARIKDVKVVIANSTNDGSTPLIWARNMRSSFASGVLIRYRGAEHGLWMLTPSTCVNNRITAYVLRLAMPTAALCPSAL